MKMKGGGEWYHSIANGLGLRRWALFFFWNQLLSLICVFPFPLAKVKFIGEIKKIGKIPANSLLCIHNS